MWYLSKIENTFRPSARQHLQNGNHPACISTGREVIEGTAVEALASACQLLIQNAGVLFAE